MERQEQAFKLDVVSIRLVKDASLNSKTPITHPRDAVKLVGEYLCDMDREVLCVINMQTDGKPINCTFASIGSLNESIAQPREIFKASILSNAAGMIILHNHPSGSLSPSKLDTVLTDRMSQLCTMMGIPLLDHIIVGGDNSHYFSFKEKGILPVSEIELETDYRNLNLQSSVIREEEENYMDKARTTVKIPTITVEPSVVFFEEERPDEFKRYSEQRQTVKETWQSILNNENRMFRGAQFVTPGNGQTVILTHSVRENIDWQLSFIDRDGIPAMHENYVQDPSSPEYSSLNNMDRLYSRLTNFSLHGNEISVEVEYGKKVVKVQSANISNYDGYDVFSQFDRNGLEAKEKIYLGKKENYDNRGNYDNTDNSLVFISDNGKMYSFLTGEGWTESQQEMIENGAFSVDDYAEYARLREGVLKQFEQIRLQEVKFDIDIQTSNSGVPFRYPNWNQGREKEMNEEITKVAIESTEDYTDPEFHKEITDTNVQNEDGTYGKVADFYRIVTIGEDGKVIPYDGRVFASEEEARQAVQEDKTLNLVNYDSLINEAGENIMRATAEEEVRRNGGTEFTHGEDEIEKRHLNENSQHIHIDGHVGTWYVIEKKDIEVSFNNDKPYTYFLLEHEAYGQDAAGLIVNEEGKVIVEDVYNGFDDLQTEIDELYSTLNMLRSAGYDIVEVTDTLGCTIKDIDGTIYTYESYNDLFENINEDYRFDNMIRVMSERVTQAMEIAGYHLDETASTTLAPTYDHEGMAIPLHFGSLRENIEWMDGTMFDAPEVDRILRPRRFEERQLGERNENITLHIRYAEPKDVNGFHIENDTITFDNVEDVEAYANGETVYDALDNAVRKGEDEILVYAENERGEVVWEQREDPKTLTEQTDVLENEKEYKYYSTQRPVGIGTYPREGMQSFINYEKRTYVDAIGREAWGELTYNRPLTQQELAEYELQEIHATAEQEIITDEEILDDDTVDMEIAEEFINLDGHICERVEEWENGTESYIIGQDIEDNTFYYAQIRTAGNVYTYEYDERPSREKVEEDHLNHMAELDIDRHEAEFGADGNQTFPHLNDESQPIERLAERIDNFMYENDTYEYKDNVGDSYESRYGNRRLLTEQIENGNVTEITETIREIRDNLTETNDHTDYTAEIREADDILYSLQKPNEYMKYFDRASMPNAELPIREFRNNEGKILDGEAIPVEISENAGIPDRSIVFRAIEQFEDANNIPEDQKEIKNGSFTDGESLYNGYDRYIGMSHRNDLSIQPYMERVQKLIPDAFLSLSLIAEIYYAQQNGLSELQINYILENIENDKHIIDTTHNLRRGLERGLSNEQVSVLLGEEPSVQRAFTEHMVHGGRTEDVIALKGGDITDYYIISPHLRDGSIGREHARVIVQEIQEIKQKDQERYNQQREKNIENATLRFSSMDYEFFTEYLTNAVVNNKDIPVGKISEVCNSFMEQTDTNNFRTYIEEHGGIIDFRPHGEQKGKKMQEENEEAKNGISFPEEQKSPKDLLKEQLKNGIQETLNSENYKNWLDTSSNMYLNNYSFNNAILVWTQKPDASYTMGYEQWKNYGRNVTQGAKGIKIFTPIIAYEKKDGDLWRMIKNNLQAQMKKDPSLSQATYHVGATNLEFTMNKNNLYAVRIGGKEQGIHTEKEIESFIKHNVIGKVPMYYNIGTVFDVKDTVIPEHLWVKNGYTKDELVKDKNGKPIKNRRGEYKIINTPERQARFQPELDLTVPEKDPEKMTILYEALKTVSEKNGIHVYEKEREEDSELTKGADGYYSRAFDEKNPKGYIVIPTDLEPTKRVSVMLHEMSHSELHGNLTKLAEKMGEDNIPSSMREIQAESVAYAVGKKFGIDTETSSFHYLAAYSQGFELQALSKSIEVIYKECRQLTAELKAELDERGFYMDLSPKENSVMEKESVETVLKSYATYVVEQDKRIENIEKELPSTAERNKKEPEVLSIIVRQSVNIDRQKKDVSVIKDTMPKLESSGSLKEQREQIAIMESAKKRIEEYKQDYTSLSEQLKQSTRQENQNLKNQFVADPVSTIESMKKTYPKLGKLTDAQVQYLGKSDYVLTNLSPLLRDSPEQFADKAFDRASQLDKVISKNGMFVEVNYCEQWTDKPIVRGGAIMHPKIADSIIKQGEMQIRGLKKQAEKTGEYFPYTKCSINIYQAEKGQIVNTFKTRIDIGDGTQTGLSDLLKQETKSKPFVESFEKATREKGAKEKIIFNKEPERELKKESQKEKLSERYMSKEEWMKEIKEEKLKDKGGVSTEREKQDRESDKEHEV